MATPSTTVAPRPLYHATTPVSGIMIEGTANKTNGSAYRVNLMYNLSYLGKEPAPSGPYQKILVQTPRFRRGFLSVWGATGRVDPPYTNDTLADRQAKIKINLDLAGEDDPASDIHKFVHGFYEPFETLVVETAKRRVDSWFKKPINPDSLDSLYTSAIKPSSDPDKWARKLNVTLPVRDGKLVCDIYDKDRQLVPFATFAEVAKHSEITAIVEMPSIWFMNKMFGMTPIVRAIQFFPSTSASSIVNRGYCFIDATAGGSGSNGGSAPNSDDERGEGQPPNKRMCFM